MLKLIALSTQTSVHDVSLVPFISSALGFFIYLLVFLLVILLHLFHISNTLFECIDANFSLKKWRGESHHQQQIGLAQSGSGDGCGSMVEGME